MTKKTWIYLFLFLANIIASCGKVSEVTHKKKSTENIGLNLSSTSEKSSNKIVMKYLPPVPNVPLVKQETLSLNQTDYNAFVDAKILVPSEKLSETYDSKQEDETEKNITKILESSSVKNNKSSRSNILNKKIERYRNKANKKEIATQIITNKDGTESEITPNDDESMISELASSSFDAASNSTTIKNTFEDSKVQVAALSTLIKNILDPQSPSQVQAEKKAILNSLGLDPNLFSKDSETLDANATLSRLQDSLKLYHLVKSSPKYITGNHNNNATYALFKLARTNIKTILEPMILEIENISEYGSSPLVGSNDNIAACDTSHIEYSDKGLMTLADWPLKKSMPCVLNQGSRGVCTAFATTSGLQMAALLQFGVNRPLSQQGLYFLAKMIWSGNYYTGYTHDGYTNGKYLNYMVSQSLKPYTSGVYWAPYEEDWAFVNKAVKKGTLDCSTVPKIASSMDPILPPYSYCSLSYAQGGYACVKGSNTCGLIAPLTITKGGVAAVETHSLSVIGDWRQTYIAIAKIVKLLEKKIPLVIGGDSAGLKISKDGYVTTQPDTEGGGHAMHLVGYVPYSESLKNAGVPFPQGSFEDPDSDFDEFDFSDDPIIATKYDNHPIHPNGYFVIKNSWGTNHGDGGFDYVDRRYLELYISGANTINKVTIIDSHTLKTTAQTQVATETQTTKAATETNIKTPVWDCNVTCTLWSREHNDVLSFHSTEKIVSPINPSQSRSPRTGSDLRCQPNPPHFPSVRWDYECKN